MRIKGSKEKPKIKNANIAQNNPAKTTVVNFGVSGFHLIVTVYKAKPVADINPIIAPKAVPEILSFITVSYTHLTLATSVPV